MTDDPRQSELLARARQIWADQPPMNLEHVTAAACTVTGDIARICRNRLEGGDLDDAALQKELGNLVFSALRWASDLGYDPAECLAAAEAAQRAYVASKP